MKYCVHINDGAGQWHYQANSLESIRHNLKHETWSTDASAWVARACDDCNDRENHHDYPEYLFIVTPKGVRREVV